MTIVLGCGKGLVSADFATAPCLPCPQGHYELNGACQRCPQLTTTPGVGAVSLDQCNLCAPEACNGKKKEKNKKQQNKRSLSVETSMNGRADCLFPLALFQGTGNAARPPLAASAPANSATGYLAIKKSISRFLTSPSDAAPLPDFRFILHSFFLSLLLSFPISLTYTFSSSFFFSFFFFKKAGRHARWWSG